MRRLQRSDSQGKHIRQQPLGASETLVRMCAFPHSVRPARQSQYNALRSKRIRPAGRLETCLRHQLTLNTEHGPKFSGHHIRLCNRPQQSAQACARPYGNPSMQSRSESLVWVSPYLCAQQGPTSCSSNWAAPGARLVPVFEASHCSTQQFYVSCLKPHAASGVWLHHNAQAARCA